jgi:hypothetical protein
MMDELDQKALRTAYAASIQAARDMYVDDDLQIDDDPNISEADEGVWVSAWVWVSNGGEN